MRPPRRLLLPAAALAVLTVAARGDEENGIRCSVAPVADVDGDGCGDVAVAARHAKPGWEVPGRVWIVSPRTGAVLRTVEAPPGGGSAMFGRTLADVGDLDGDGATDLTISSANRVRVISGKSGRPLFDLELRPGRTAVGDAISGGRDVDGDGRPDIAVFRTTHESADHQWPPLYGVVTIHSGSTGQLLRAIAGPLEPRTVEGERQARLDTGRITPAVALVADRDGDGRAELALVRTDGAPGEREVNRLVLDVVNPWSLESFVTAEIPPPGQGTPWLVRDLGDVNGDGTSDLALTLIEDDTLVCSGATGAELQRHTYRGGYLKAEGSSLDLVGDVDGDGVPDYLVAANEDSLDCDPGFVVVHSGADGKVVRSLHFEYGEGGTSKGCGPGADACAIGDVDGDGTPDVAVHVPRLGQLRILSGATFEELLRVDTSAFPRKEAGAPR